MPSLRSKILWRLTPGYYTAKMTEWALLSPVARRLCTEAVRQMVPDRPLGGKPSRLKIRVENATSEMRRDGFTRFGRVLSDADIRELHELAGRLKCIDPWDESAGSFPADRAPATCHTAQFARSDLLQSQLVRELANDPTVLAIAQSYLGGTPTLSNLTMWWSLAGRPAPKEAQLFHRDRDDLRFCKLFFYLTDVDMESGPHVYVRGSASEWVLTEPRRLSDAEVTGQFGEERITYFCEPEGHSFLVDTFGVHKGFLPKSRDRLILQVEYSLLPIGRESYWRDAQLSSEGEFDRYVNRLFIRGASRFARKPWLTT